jgi:hypothetical protein
LELEALSHQLKPFHTAWLTQWSEPMRMEDELPTQFNFFNFHVGGGSVIGSATSGYFTLTATNGENNSNGAAHGGYFMLGGVGSGSDIISCGDFVSPCAQSHTLVPLAQPLVLPSSSPSIANSATNIASSTHSHVAIVSPIGGGGSGLEGRYAMVDASQPKHLHVDVRQGLGGLGVGNVSVELGSLGQESGMGIEKVAENPKQREALRGGREEGLHGSMFLQQHSALKPKNRFDSRDNDGEEEEEEEDGREHEEIVYNLAPIFPHDSRASSPISASMSRVTTRRLSRGLPINLAEKTEDGGESGANIVSDDEELQGHDHVSPLSRGNTPLRAIPNIPRVTSSMSSRRLSSGFSRGLSTTLLTATTEDGGESDANIVSEDEEPLYEIAPVITPTAPRPMSQMSSLSSRAISPLSTLLTATTEDGGESGANIVSEDEPNSSAVSQPIAIRANFVRASPHTNTSARRLPRGYQATNLLASSPTADGGESDANIVSSEEDEQNALAPPKRPNSSSATTTMLAAAIAQDGGESDANIISTTEEENNNAITPPSIRSPNLTSSMQRVISPISISSRRLSRALSTNLLTATTEDGGESGANIVSEDEQNSTPQVHRSMNPNSTLTNNTAITPMHSIPLKVNPVEPTLRREASNLLVTATTEDGGESGGFVSIHEDEDQIDSRVFNIYSNAKKELSLNLNASALSQPSTKVTATSLLSSHVSQHVRPPSSNNTNALSSPTMQQQFLQSQQQPQLSSQKTNTNSINQSLPNLNQTQSDNRPTPLPAPRIYVPDLASDVESVGTFIPAYSTTTSAIPPFPKRRIPYSLGERLMQQQMQRMDIQQTLDGRFYTTDPKCENLFKMIDYKESVDYDGV